MSPRQRVLQSAATEPQQAQRDGDAVNRSRQLRGWRTVKELTDELRFPSENACRMWLSRHRIPSVRRGRVILVDGLDIDQRLRHGKHRASSIPPSSTPLKGSAR